MSADRPLRWKAIHNAHNDAMTTSQEKYSHIHRIWEDEIRLQEYARIACEREQILKPVIQCTLRRAADALDVDQELALRELEGVSILENLPISLYRVLAIKFPSSFADCHRKNSLHECGEIGALHRTIGLPDCTFPEWSALQIDTYLSSYHEVQ